DIGRGARALEARRALVLVACRDKQPDIGEPPPRLCVIRREGEDLNIDIGCAFEVLLPQERVGLLLQLYDRLLDGAGLVLKVRLERNSSVVERVVVEGLLGGGGRGGDENEQRGDKAGAEPCKHCFLRGPARQRAQDPYGN